MRGVGMRTGTGAPGHAGRALARVAITIVGQVPAGARHPSALVILYVQVLRMTLVSRRFPMACDSDPTPMEEDPCPRYASICTAR
jgi:hypothetical protein